MDELKERIARLSPERREALRRLAPEQYAALIAAEAPGGEVEDRLLGIWSEVLGVPVSREDNYFELGGDSIVSVSIVAKARAAGLALTPRMLFRHPTIVSLVAALNDPTPADPVGSEPASTDAQFAPLTPLQQGMVFHSQFETASSAYVSQLSCALSDTIDRDRLETAWGLLVRRHAILGAAVDLDDPMQPRLRHDPHTRPVVEYRKLDCDTKERSQLAMQAFLREDFARAFDLTRAPLMRLTLLETSQGAWRFVWTHHHLLLDGWSQLIVLQEFQALYLGESLAPVTTSFKDYAAWLRRCDLVEAAAFWKAYLHGATPMPLPRGTGAADATQARLLRRFGAAEFPLHKIARRFRVAPAVVVQAAWALALGRLTGAADPTFGLTATVRPAELADSERIVGLCINTLPMRVAIAPEGTVAEWLERLQAVQSEWLHNAHASLSDVLRWAQATPNIFDTLLVFENLPKSAADPQGALICDIGDVVSTVREHYPIVMVVTPGEELIAELKTESSIVNADQADLAMTLFACALKSLHEVPTMQEVGVRLRSATHEHSQALRDKRVADDRRRLLQTRRVSKSFDPGASL